ncbi:hypothetical protein Hypma_002805 [Hypsizygus marmoreus]|uniref:DNA endonuclease activator Ctp1 C-terminal domain-containing protein n=1 Tax=Hypsizygus marmoreus TaxID=39966 RepID=A0A369JCJ3_HYPMA|nr:hypothetical protein Hypma_002805 [Hypsizygus marmoreus]
MESVKAFSSSHLRERDKILQEKHQKELSILERKIERLRWSNNDTLKQLFEAQTRGKRLAQSLGFNDIYEAQVTVDTADRELPYKECLERVETLQVELSSEKAHYLTSLDQMKLLEEENERLKVTLAALEKAQAESKTKVAKHKSTSERLAQEVTQLQARYDSLADVKERAAARYKLDYAKWRKFKDWMFTEEEEHAKDRNETGISDEDRRKKDIASLMRKKKMMMEIGLDLRQFEGEEGESVKIASPYPPPPPLGGITNLECDKENQATPMPVQKKRRLLETPFLSSPLPPSPTAVASPNISIPPSSNATIRARTIPLRNHLLKSTVNSVAPSSSPSPFLDKSTNTRQPLIFQPIVQRSPQVKHEARSSPPMIDVPRATKRQHPDTNGSAASSDTEDESQAISQFHAPAGPFKVPTSPVTSPVAMDSSQTEPESQSQIIFPDPTPCPSRPFPKVPAYPLLHARPALRNVSRRDDSNVVSRDVDTFRPLKMRRLSGENRPLSPPDLTTPKSAASGEESSHSWKGKGKAIEPPFLTPLNESGLIRQKHLEDYSAFKGRGRYGKDVVVSKNSINAQYVIDPAKNGGLDFQYDEVVRNKEERKRMDAGDCECCRDYYEAVGPLPSRLKAPLWRSPPATPVKPCAQHQHHLTASGSRSVQRDDSHQSEIRSHKQAISRHRHRWARAKTPPGYWNIGFPDTQEAEDINEQAREMHRRKQAEVEASAKRDDGKYKMRG